jgi:hypothetical protein
MLDRLEQKIKDCYSSLLVEHNGDSYLVSFYDDKRDTFFVGQGKSFDEAVNKLMEELDNVGKIQALGD